MSSINGYVNAIGNGGGSSFATALGTYDTGNRYKGEPRDIILYEDNCIKYKLFNTTLYLYDFETRLHKVLCSNYSNTTASRVKALLTMDPDIMDVYMKNGKYCTTKNYDQIETIANGGIYEW